MPCNHDKNCAPVPEGTNPSDWQFDSWDHYLCSYMGGGPQPPNTKMPQPNTYRSAAVRHLGERYPMIAFCNNGPDCSVKPTRINCGARVSVPVYTYNFRLFMRDEGNELKYSMFGLGFQFIGAFTPGLWAMGICSVLLAGLSLWVIEGKYDGELKQMTRTTLLEAVWRATACMIGAADFEPKTV